MNNNEQISKSRIGRLLNSQTAIDFYGRRKVGFIAAIVIVIITLVSLFTQGLNLGLDFEGGNAWDVPASDTFDIHEADQVLRDQGIDTAGARIQRRSSESADVVTVQIEEVSNEKSAAITAALADAAGVDRSEVSVSFTSSTWGKEITEKAIRALVVFFIVVSLFISLRFEWRMAVAAIVAMVHDVIVVVGVYSVFQFEVTPATVVAFLTILGYSLYDTIVVFDRVKENQAKFAVRAHAVPRHRQRLDEPGADALAQHEHRLGPAGAVAAGDRLGSARRGGARGVRARPVHRHGRRASTRRSSWPRRCSPRCTSDTSGKVRRERLTGEPLRAAVIGSSASGRDASRVYAMVGAEEVGTATASESIESVDQPGSTTVRRGPTRRSDCSPTRRGRARRSATDAPPTPAGILGTWQASTARCEGSSATSPTTRRRRHVPRHHAAARRRRRRSAGRSTSLVEPFDDVERRPGASASRPAASSSPRRSPTAWAPASCRCARPASCRGRWSARSTSSSTAPTSSRSTATRSTPASGSWSSTTCSPPAAPPRPRRAWSRRSAASSSASAS